MKVRDRICVAIGGAALGTSVLAVGGVLRWTQAIVAFLVAGALATQLLSSRKLGRLSPLVAILGTAIVLCLVQLIPLPGFVLEALNSTGYALRQDGAALSGTSPWEAISLEPSETLRHVAFFVTLLGVAVLSLRFAASERGRFALLAGVCVTCGIAAVVTGVHTLVNADALYGVYEPQYAKGETVMGPMLNANHMGGLMAIGVVLSVGLAFYHRQRAQLRVLWVIVGLACAVVCAMSFSRGAMLGMLIGLIVASVILVTGRITTPTLRRRSLRNNLPVAIVIGVGLAVALYFSAGQVVSQLEDTSVSEVNGPTSKYEAWKSSIELVKESPVFGVGRGATEATLTRVHPASGRNTFSHLENEYLEVLVEWGIVGAVLMAGLAGWALSTAYRRRRDGPLAAAALGASAMIAFQSMVDFGVDHLGLAVPCVIIVSTIQLVPLRVASWTLPVRLVRVGLILLLVTMGFVLLSPATRSLREDRDMLAAETATPNIDDIRASIERHPLDYIGYGEAASLAWRNADPVSIAYLNHALRLHPTHPGLHRLAARLLAQANRRDQAALEYSLAMSAEASPRRLLEEILLVLPAADDAALALPVNYPNITVMLHSLEDVDRKDVSIKWLSRVVQHDPDMDPIDKLYDLAMDRPDYDVALMAADLRWKRSKTTTSHLKRARVQFARKEYEVLEKDLADVASWTGRIDEKASAWLILCDVHIEQKAWDKAVQCLHQLDASGLSSLGRIGITKRLANIDQERTYDAKLKAIKDLEKTLVKPKTP